jgi:hypothetical protein
MKRLLKIVAVLVLLIVVGLVAAYIYIDVIAKSAIERGSTYALGVQTTLESAKLKIFDGQLVMGGLHVSNPQGYEASHFLTMKEGDVAVTLASLRQDTVQVNHLHLIEIDVNLQKKDGKSNYNVILENLKRLETTPDPDAEAQRYVVNDLQIRNVVLHVDLLGGGTLTKVNVPIDKIQLKNVGSDTPRGVLLSDLSGVIIKAILAAAADKAGSIIPDDIVGDLKGQLAQLQSIEKLADVESLGELAKPIEEITGQLGSEIKNLGDKATGEVGKAIGDIFGGKKKQE